ncbi:hypothetical protein KW805_02680 [Candidatus Pacearchaeota archaeon]|nr:hypothetical protein [Candidatus Pacearchaeota archaeon]
MRKGILPQNTLEAIIAVLGIALILGAVGMGIFHFTSNQESESAKATINILEGKINALEAGQEARFSIRGVNEWYLKGWSNQDPAKPDVCFLSSCLCICPSNTKDSCQTKGFCRKFDVATLSVKAVVSDGMSPKGLDLPLYQGVDYIQFPRNLIELKISKTSGGVYIGVPQ